MSVDVKKKHLRLKFVNNIKKAPFLEYYGAEFNSRAGGLWRTFVKFLVQRATLWNKARGHQVLVLKLRWSYFLSPMME